MKGREMDEDFAAIMNDRDEKFEESPLSQPPDDDIVDTE